MAARMWIRADPVTSTFRGSPSYSPGLGEAFMATDGSCALEHNTLSNGTITADANRAKIARLAAVNIVTAAAVMGIKYVAYYVSGSVALYSDAMESIVNVMTAIAALVAVQIAHKPPDAEHPFGHHKAEFFAAIFEGAMIVIAALLILTKAYSAFRSGPEFNQAGLGLAINAFAAIINSAWAYLLISSGRNWRSPALVADGWHLVTDVITSIGVILGLIVAVLAGWKVLDAIIAAIIALNILWTGYRIALQSMSSLMDQAASPQIEEQIQGVITANGHGALQAHDIRTRQAGRALFIEFHLVVPGNMTVNEAHTICDRLEDAIEIAIEGSEVVIHVEPEYKAKSRAQGAVNI
jgi:cation diffusion facilitator family transporter